MANVCLYFELHQPYRLASVSVFDIGLEKEYFVRQEEQNRKIFQKVAHKSYIPMLTLLLKLARESREFFFAFSATGVFLEQALEYAPKVVTLLQKLVATGQVEVLAETYHHSLASLYSPEEFRYQVKEHEKLVQKLFAVKPRIFRNTELIYSNDIGQLVEDMGYDGCLTEAVDRYLQGEKRTQLFVGKTKKQLPLLLKHAQLSDDIAFRFSDKSWVSYPLTSDTYLSWLNSYQHDEIINLFMDFETFGEHQWEDTGIFEFFKVLVAEILKHKKVAFVTPSQAIELNRAKDSNSKQKQLPLYDVPEPISWADVDRDLTAWVDNELQKDTIQKLYALEEKIVAQKNKELLADWRKLQTSDHFYYMCTKWAADGDVHAYFSPYESPFEAYRRYAIVLADLQERML
ncbi:glycoside hydrolase family 57 protein [Candidatus Woesebacteria bacterium]|nr:glycoside hydrolase family 57 protein [Candidatus Woesebacteria bacterium]